MLKVLKVFPAPASLKTKKKWTQSPTVPCKTGVIKATLGVYSWWIFFKVTNWNFPAKMNKVELTLNNWGLKGYRPIRTLGFCNKKGNLHKIR